MFASCCHDIFKMAGDEETFPWPRAQEARDYLAKHKVLELFDNVTSQLIYERPDKQDNKRNNVHSLTILQVNFCLDGLHKHKCRRLFQFTPRISRIKYKV